MKKRFLWLLCLWLSSPNSLHAQEATPESPQVTGRRVWVVATTMPQDAPNPLPILIGDQLHKVQMHLRAIGQAVPIDDTGLVRAVKQTQGPDGKISYEDLARSVVPAGVGEALIVLVPKSNDEEGLMFKSKVIDLSKFKKGGCLYVNLVKTKIGITIGEQKTVVEPGGMEFINPLEGENHAVLPVRFFYEVPKEPNAEWKLMTSSKMAIYESRREICIFFYNKEIENVDFRGIPFMTPPPPMPQQR